MKKLSIWWILAIAAIVVVIGGYISAITDETLVIALCSTVAIIVAGYFLEKEDKLRSQKNDDFIQTTTQASAEIKENIYEFAATTKQTMDSNCQHLEKEFKRVCNLLDKNETSRKQDFEKMQKGLNTIDASLVDVVDAYEEITIRMAALEQQNIHLQHLTTLIGTVRSDIAAINEIKGFIEEHKAGRKIRIVRDDENKIIVENLMNGDGVRIEKSKMYRNKQLVFEAEFNDVGKMVSSRSYDKDENLNTEVIYTVDNQGKPKLIEKLAKVLQSVKR